MRSPIGLVVNLGWGLALAVLAGLAVVSYYSSGNQKAAEDLVIHTHQVLGSLDSVLAAVNRAESSHADYILTGNDHFRELYQAASENIGLRLKIVEQTADSPQQQEGLKKLRGLVSEKQALLEHSLQLHAAKSGLDRQIEVAAKIAQADEAVTLAIGEMKREEDRLLLYRTRKLQESSIWSASSSLLGDLVAFLAVAGAGVLVNLELRRRKTALKALGQARADLENRVTARTADLTVANETMRREMSERERAQADLEALRRQLELILDSAGEGIYGIDRKGVTMFANAAALRMTGYTAEELLGKSPHEILHHTRPDGTPLPLEECRIYAALADGTTHHADDECFWRKDGTSFSVEYTSTPIVEGSAVRGAVVVFKDITRRKRAETELQFAHDALEQHVRLRTIELDRANMELRFEVEERGKIEKSLRETGRLQRAILDSANSIIISTGMDGTVRTFNAAAQRLLGYRPNEVVGKLSFTVFLGQDEPGNPGLGPRFERWAAWAREGEAKEDEDWMVRRDRTRFPVLLSVTALHDEEGLVNGFLAVGTDITERKRADEQIRQSEERSRSVLSHLLDGVVTFDESGRIEWLNPAAEMLFGYPAQEVIGQSITLLTPDPYHEAGPLEVADFLHQRGPFLTGNVHEVVGRDREGQTIPMELALSAYEMNGRRHFTGSIRDISQRKRDQQHLATQHGVTQVIAESLTLEELSPRLLEVIRETLAWDIGILWLVDPNAQLLRAAHISLALDFEAPNFCRHCEETTFVSGAGLVGQVWATGQLVWSRDVVQDARFSGSEAAGQDGLHAGFAAPISFGDEVLGVLAFFSREVRISDTDLLQMFTTIGAQVGMFIQRKRAEQERDQFFTLALDLMASVDYQGKFRRLNPAWERLLGYNAPDTIGRPFGPLLHPDDVVPMTKLFEAQVANGQPLSGHCRFRHRDGRYRLVEWTSVPVPSQRLIYSTARDVTEAKRQEEALRESERFARSTVDALSAHIAILDGDGTILAVNKAWRDFGITGGLGLPVPPEGDNYLKICDVSGESAVRVADGIRDVIGGSRVEYLREYACHNDHQRCWYMCRVTRFHGVGPVRVVVAHENITRRKLAEEAILRAADEAAAANRAKSDFLAKMSHELRTPLNSVIGFANVLLKNKAKNLAEKDLSYLSRILDNGKHLLGLINDVLDLSKVEAGKMELALSEIRLDVLVPEVLGQLEGQVKGRPVKLVADVPAGLAPIQTDPVKLKQVIINLVGNALKFTASGSVTLRVLAGSDGRPLALDVIDTGIGIPADRQQAIFEAFQQADNTTTRRYGGTGLGLTISRSLCQLLGYRVLVYSTVGKGSIFRVVLAEDVELPAPPMGEAEAPPTVLPEAVPVESAVGWSGHKRVLVIDDQPDARALMTQMLEELGCQVWTAPSGPEGMELARQHKPDLITLDLMMPQVSGWDMLRQLKADPEVSHIPVVIVSIVARDDKAALIGAFDLLDKPVSQERLTEVLQRAFPPRGGRVLVVEDDADTRQILCEYLTAMGVEVRTACDGRHALDEMQVAPPDLVILDLMMPVMDGMALLEAIRQGPHFPTLPIIVLTAKELTEEERGRLKAQTSGILRKGGLFEEELKKLVGDAVAVKRSPAGPVVR
jgi:PAS domain S-box-containing protein